MAPIRPCEAGDREAMVRQVELGFGSGGNDVTFSVFGRHLSNRQSDYDRAFAQLHDALAGKPLVPDAPPLFPPARPHLLATMWEAAMSLPSSVRAGQHGSGLLLARTAARSHETEGQPLGEVQKSFVDAYLAHYANTERPARIGLSRSVYVAKSRTEAIADAEPGIRRHAEITAARTGRSPDAPVEELLARQDVHIGTPDEVIASLRADPLLERASDLIVQVHPVDPSPAKTLRSFELITAEVAPALGWRPASTRSLSSASPG